MSDIGEFPEFSMSFSRARLLKECKRAYYWKSYGGWQGWNRGDKENDPDTRMAYCLSKGSNLYSIAGSLVHETAESIVIGSYQDVPIPEIEREGARLLDRLTRAVEESYHLKWKKDPKGSPMLLDAFYSEDGTVPKDKLEKIEERLHKCLHGLYNNPYLKKIRRGIGARAIELVNCEQIEQVVLDVDGEMVPVWIVPDLVVRTTRADPVRYGIADWKTGKVQKEDIAQTGLYAHWLSKRFGVKPEQVTTTTVYLQHDMESSMQATPTAMEAAVEGIREGVRMAKELVVDGDLSANRPKPIEEFTQEPERSRACRFCDWRRMCHRAGRRY